jgi:hypothetical protein
VNYFTNTTVIVLTSLGMSFFHFSSADVRVQVSEPSQAKVVGGQTSTLTPGTFATIDLNHPVEITSESRVPIILVPVTNKNVEITIDAPKVQEVLKKVTDEEMNQKLSVVMGKLYDVQGEIQKHNLSQAMQKLQTLETEHPSLTFLEFTRASILLLQGNRDEARRVAELASKSLPEYEDGRGFVKKLKEQGSP